MLHHIALTVTDPEEIRNFYEEVLLFSLRYKFSLDTIDVLRQLFHTDRQTEVYVMKHQDVQLEIFIDPVKEKKRFSHVCFQYRETGLIFDQAVKSGYRTWTKKNSGRLTYFIWDKSENLFEIKEMEES
ncbi:MAG: VOC family protein [Mangrovibacterium sp.]